MTVCLSVTSSQSVLVAWTVKCLHSCGTKSCCVWQRIKSVFYCTVT